VLADNWWNTLCSVTKIDQSRLGVHVVLGRRPGTFSADCTLLSRIFPRRSSPSRRLHVLVRTLIRCADLLSSSEIFLVKMQSSSRRLFLGLRLLHHKLPTRHAGYFLFLGSEIVRFMQDSGSNQNNEQTCMSRGGG
jgi:hypothetical protein